VDGANGGGLFGIETQPIATDGVMSAPVAKAECFARQLAQSFFTQRLERRVIKFKIRHLVAPDFPLPQRGQRLLLFRRTLQAIEIDSVAVFGGKPVPHRRIAGGFPLAQQNRQSVKQNVTHWMVVVIRRPKQQTPDGGRKDRLAVQYLNDRFQFVKRQFALLADRHHNPDAFLLFAKRHAHPTPGFDGHAFRQEIVKGAG